MKYEAVGFDYGGVIVGVSGGEFEKAISGFFGVTVEKLQNVYYQHNHLLSNGVLKTGDFWRKIGDELDRPGYDAAIDYINSLSAEINPGILEFVDLLRKNGYKVGLLSNNTKEAAEKMRNNGIDKHFDCLLVSAEIGVMKPEPKAFHLLAEKLGVAADKMIYVDDREYSLKHAKEVGFYPVIYSDLITLKSDLGKIGITI